MHDNEIVWSQPGDVTDFFDEDSYVLVVNGISGYPGELMAQLMRHLQETVRYYLKKEIRRLPSTTSKTIGPETGPAEPVQEPVQEQEQESPVQQELSGEPTQTELPLPISDDEQEPEHDGFLDLPFDIEPEPEPVREQEPLPAPTQGPAMEKRVKDMNWKDALNTIQKRIDELEQIAAAKPIEDLEKDIHTDPRGVYNRYKDAIKADPRISARLYLHYKAQVVTADTEDYGYLFRTYVVPLTNDTRTYRQYLKQQGIRETRKMLIDYLKGEYQKDPAVMAEVEWLGKLSRDKQIEMRTEADVKSFLEEYNLSEAEVPFM